MQNLVQKIKFLITFGNNFNFIINLIREENAKPLEENNKKFLKKISHYYLGSNFYSFGEKNKKKIFYIIKRSPGAGFFSNLNYVLHSLLICKKKNYVPIIDMQNFKTIYNEKTKISFSNNCWEYYFKKINRYKLEEVYKSKNVIIPEKEINLEIDISNLIFSNLKIKIKIKNKIIRIFKKFEKKNFFKNDKILGIHLRGTSYKTAAGHAFPPTEKLMSEFIDNLLVKHNYNKIFLITEEKKYLYFFKKKYPNLYFYKNTYRSDKNDAFIKYPRNRHRYKLGLESIIEALILSRCDGLAYIKSNLISAAIFFSKKKQIKHEIFLGYNSRKKFISRWLWFLKRALPKKFGGLKILN